MYCYWSRDEKTGEKFLVLGCYWGIYHADDEGCQCREKRLTFQQFEKREYNQKLNELIEIIKTLESEIQRLNKIIANK